MKKVNAKEIQEQVTARVIAALESAKGSGGKWVKPWRTNANGAARRFDGYIYQGVNQFLLTLTANSTGRVNIWGTPVQWAALAKKRGESYDFRGAKCLGEIFRPNTVTVTKELVDPENPNAEPKFSRFKVVTSYSVSKVMSISDIKGTEKLLAEIAERDKLTDHERNERAEKFIAAQQAEISFGYNSASYSPDKDIIRMPELGQFYKPEDYYATLIHELTHRTGHKSRLNRPGIAEFNGFGSERYAEEELVAELGSAFVCNALGIDGETMDSHVQYIDAWLSKLRKDNKFIFKASHAASEAMRFMFKQAGLGTETAEE
jgi:antirestriction protein ArdC